jgi:hypothetical protein
VYELDPADLTVDQLDAHVTVTSPRFVLSPDQVLSTFPPAGTQGAYGSRLPQVVIKRRTLPWERRLEGASRETPWLALVVYAEGEAELLPNTPVAQCVSPGVELDGPADVETAICMEIRRSMVDRIMPTRLDVPLLAHARQVNIDDTELMLGDDDGWLAVVIANRLPLSVPQADGTDLAVTYHACLISIEGQFDALLPEAPPHVKVTHVPEFEMRVAYAASEYDRIVMDGRAEEVAESHVGVGQPHANMLREGAVGFLERESIGPPVDAGNDWASTLAVSPAAAARKDLVRGPRLDVLETFDPKLRFPVLLHWSFVTSGSDTFQTLMQRVDSGMLGTLVPSAEPIVGRPTPEVVETGHVGLTQRTRRGDVVRAWYRGPLLPHPSDGSRLELAHASDQLRSVIGDGREDLSLASAFEIGRLLALSRPSIVSALLRWRQSGYQSARSRALWKDVLDDVGFEDISIGHMLGMKLGRQLVRAVAANPLDTIGPPRELHTAGTPMDFEGDLVPVLSTGLGLDITERMSTGTIIRRLSRAEAPQVDLADLSTAKVNRLLAGMLGQARDVTALSIAEGIVPEEPQ